MTPTARERFPLRIQVPVYAIALFSGNLFPMVSVVMPLWALELGASPVVIGLIVASRHFITVLLSIHSGALMDRFGPRNIILVLGTIGAASMASYPLMPFIWAAIMLQMISGFTETTNWIGVQALVGRVLKGHAVYAGRMTAAARLGGFAGPLLVGLAWEHVGPFGAFAVLAVWMGIGVVIALFLPRLDPPPAQGAAADAPAEPRRRTRAADLLPRLSDYVTAFRLLILPAVALVVLATLVRQAGSGTQSAFYSVWLHQAGFDAGTIGLLFGIMNAVSAGTALSIGPVIRRWPGHWLLIAAVTLAVVGIAVTPLLDSFYLLALAISVRGLGQGLNLPLLMSIASTAVGPDLQGRVVALRISLNRIGSLVVPLATGAVAEFVGLANAFYVVGATGLVLIALLATWVARKPAFRRAA